MFPDDPDNVSIPALDQYLQRFSDSEPYYQVSIRVLLDVLDRIIPSPDFRLQSIKQMLQSLMAESSTSQGILIVRRNRKVNKGTGALLSPNDLKTGQAFNDKPVLTLYKIDPSIIGWKQQELWVPNIKLPGNRIYYDAVN